TIRSCSGPLPTSRSTRAWWRPWRPFSPVISRRAVPLLPAVQALRVRAEKQGDHHDVPGTNAGDGDPKGEDAVPGQGAGAEAEHEQTGCVGQAGPEVEIAGPSWERRRPIGSQGGNGDRDVLQDREHGGADEDQPTHV